MKNIVRSDNVGLNRLHRKKFAGRHLLQGRRVKNVVNTRHRVSDGLGAAHIADVELHLFRVLRVVRLKGMAHIVLFFLVAGEDANLLQVRVQKMLQNRRTERPRTAGNHKGGVIKCRHFFLLFKKHS